MAVRLSSGHHAIFLAEKRFSSAEEAVLAAAEAAGERAAVELRAAAVGQGEARVSVCWQSLPWRAKTTLLQLVLSSRI